MILKPKHVARFGIVATGIMLIQGAGCDWSTNPEPSVSGALPNSQAIEPANTSEATAVAAVDAVALSALQGLEGLDPEAARLKIESLPADVQAATRTKVMDVVADLAAAADVDREARFQALSPEMQTAVQLAIAIARVEQTDVGTRRETGKRDDRIEWCSMAYHCVTAYNCWGCPMFQFHQQVFFTFNGCSSAFITGVNQWGTVWVAFWVYSGVSAQSCTKMGYCAERYTQSCFTNTFCCGAPMQTSHPWLRVRVWFYGGATAFGGV